MVRVHTGNNGDIRREVVERAVKLICLDHNVIALRVKQEIGIIVIGYAAKKSIRSHMRRVQDMRQNGAGSCLAMRASYAESPLLTSNHAQDLRTFEDSKSLLT